MKQKFKRGNLVKIAKDLGPHMSHFENDKEAVIIGSYDDLYGGGNTSQYSLMFTDTGSRSSWYYESQLTLINEGGEHLIEEGAKKSEEIKNKEIQIDYILSKLDGGELSSASILHLFDLIGYSSRFLRNGEFYTLYREWSLFHPLFKFIKNAKSLKEAESVIKEEKRGEFNIKKVFEIFNNPKTTEKEV
jgi:hypothetical protein